MSIFLRQFFCDSGVAINSSLFFMDFLYLLKEQLVFYLALSFASFVYEQFFSGIGNINNLDIQVSSDAPAIGRVLENGKIIN